MTFPPNTDATGGRTSFWLLGDNTVALGAEESELGSFVAHLKHALLFHERLMLSDSLVVNTPNFRRALQHDLALRDYLAEGPLAIARRRVSPEGPYADLLEMRNTLRASASINYGFGKTCPSFLVDEDLAKLEKSLFPVSYEIADVKAYYTDSVRSLLNDSRFTESLGERRTVICEAILRRLGESKYIDQTFFEARTPKSLRVYVGDEVWESCAQVVRDFECAYYRNALPATIGTDVVFSEQHRRQREILRHLGPDDSDYVIRIDLSRKAKSLYESVLSRLSAKMLRELRNSDEFLEFQRQLGRLHSIESVSDPALEDAIQGVYVALDAYHSRIDSSLFVQRSLSVGTRILDNWHLRGFLGDGAWLLQFGLARILSNQKLRAVAAASLDHIVHPKGSAEPVATFLVYTAIEEVIKANKLLESFPERLQVRRLREKNASPKHKPIVAHLDLRPMLYKDSLYGGS